MCFLIQQQQWSDKWKKLKNKKLKRKKLLLRRKPSKKAGMPKARTCSRRTFCLRSAKRQKRRRKKTRKTLRMYQMRTWSCKKRHNRYPKRLKVREGTLTSYSQSKKKCWPGFLPKRRQERHLSKHRVHQKWKSQKMTIKKVLWSQRKREVNPRSQYHLSNPYRFQSPRNWFQLLNRWNYLRLHLFMQTPFNLRFCHHQLPRIIIQTYTQCHY